MESKETQAFKVSKVSKAPKEIEAMQVPKVIKAMTEI